MSAELGLYRVDYEDGSHTGSAIEIDAIIGYDDSLSVPFELLQELTRREIEKDPSLKKVERGSIVTAPETKPVHNPLSAFAKEHPVLASLIVLSLIGTTAALAAKTLDNHANLTFHDLRLLGKYYEDLQGQQGQAVNVNIADDSQPIQEGYIQTSLANPEQTQYQPDNPDNADNIAISNYEQPWSLQTFGDLGLTGQGAKVIVLGTGMFTPRLENNGVGIADSVIDARRPLGEYELCVQPPPPESNCGRDFYFHEAKTTILTDNISPGAEITNIAVLDGNGNIRQEWIQNAADIIAQEASDSQGLIIANISFGWGENIQELPSAIIESITNIINNPNVLVVASAGNNYSSGCDWPQRDFQGTLNVGAVNILENGEIEMRPSSSWGTNCVDLVAPGGGLLFLTDANGELIIDQQTGEPIPLRGTSFAAPQITGQAALFLEALDNHATPEQLTNLILATTRPLTGSEYLPIETLTRAFTPDQIINTPSILFGFGIPTIDSNIETLGRLPENAYPALTTLQIRPDNISSSRDGLTTPYYYYGQLQIIGGALRPITFPDNGAAENSFYTQIRHLGRLNWESGSDSPIRSNSLYFNTLPGETTIVYLNPEETQLPPPNPPSK